MNIQLGNLTLRLLTKEDGPHFFDLIERNRIRLRDYFPITISLITDLAVCIKYVDEKVEQTSKKEHFCFVIENEQGCLQGLFFIKDLDWRIPKGELAYFIDQSLEGMWIMTKALSAVVSYCFDVLEMNKLSIITAVDNYPSKKIAEKNGFEIEGILRNDYRIASGKLIDNIYYGLLKSRQ